MDVIHDLERRHPRERPAVVTVGNFDGVHAGHQALVRRVIARARSLGGDAIALTFDPHPQAFLHPASAPVPLTSMPERIELLAAQGLDALAIVRFTAELANLEAESFLERYLQGLLGTAELYVGSNFGFGRGKRGNIELLNRMAPPLGFTTGVVDLVTDEGALISSTRIRKLLGEGDLATARAELTRPYQVYGTVVPGDGRGRSIGFPTANVLADKPCVLPHGVYAVTARLLGSTFGGALNFGMRPTFQAAAPQMEVHLLDFEGPDLAGQPIRLQFHERLREERRFSGVEELKGQIGRDVERARSVLKEVTG